VVKYGFVQTLPTGADDDVVDGVEVEVDDDDDGLGLAEVVLVVVVGVEVDGDGVGLALAEVELGVDVEPAGVVNAASAPTIFPLALVATSR